MKSKIEIFGRKVSIATILIVILVIGTASAAVFEHYAKMEGNLSIGSPISVSIDGTEIGLGDTYTLTVDDMTSPCIISETFDISNIHGEPLDVNILWILYETGAEPPLNADETYWIYDNETVSIPSGGMPFTAELSVPAYMIGDYTFSIEINPVFE